MGELGELRDLGKLGVPVLKRTGAYPWVGLGEGFPFRFGVGSVWLCCVGLRIRKIKGYPPSARFGGGTPTKACRHWLHSLRLADDAMRRQ